MTVQRLQTLLKAEYELAIDQFQVGVKLAARTEEPASAHVEAVRNLAYCYLALNDAARAYSMVEKAIASDDGTLRVQVRGLLYLAQAVMLVELKGAVPTLGWNFLNPLRSKKDLTNAEEVMNARNFSAFLKQFALLSQRQRAHLLTLLHPVRDSAAEVIDAVTGAQPVCPHCTSAVIYRHGRANGLQRYRCRSCGKTFNGLTGTPLARLHHRARWFDYLDCMIDAKSVRRAAATAGVHRNTSFRWRHRFLMAAQVAPARLTGIAEADETFLRESARSTAASR